MIGDVIRRVRLPYRDVHLYAGEGIPRETGDLEGLVVMGGPMSANDLVNHPFLIDEIQLLEKVLADRKPVLGVCLGAQLLAKALGSRVFPSRHIEVGWRPIQFTRDINSDPLFSNAPPSLDVFHWHGDTFDLPAGATRLARSLQCENQLFRWGEWVYGFQFHIEVTTQMAMDWCHADWGKAYIQQAGQSHERILADSQKYPPQLRPLTEKIFSTYFQSAYKTLLPLV
jgi:GMP synthase-like glutamine amidotransferase